MQSLGMVEQQQGGSGAKSQWSYGQQKGLEGGVDGVDRQKNKKKNCIKTWGDETIIGSLRGKGASTGGAFERCWRDATATRLERSGRLVGTARDEGRRL